VVLLHSPADIVRMVLIAEGQGTLPTSPPGAWPIYAHNEPTSPDNCITLYDTDGRQHGRTGPDRERQEHYGVQIRIRARDGESGFVKAHAVAVALDALIDYDSLTIDGTRYIVHSVTRTSGVISLGKEMAQSKRHLYTVNAIVSITKPN
jgi:hypothetical protein